MMMQDLTDKLVDDIDSRYTLIVMASKRARQIVDGSEPLIETESLKPVSIATEEIGAGEVTFTRPDDVDAMDAVKRA